MIRINLLGVSKEALSQMAAQQGSTSEVSAGFDKYKGFIFGAMALVALLIAGGMLMSKTSRLDDLRGQLNVELDRKKRLEKVQQKADEFEEAKARLNKKIEVISSLKNNQVTPVYIMDEVSRRLDKHVWLTDMKLSGNRLTLKGSAFTYIAMTNFMAQLRSSAYVQDIILKRADEKKGNISYEMDCILFRTTPAPEKKKVSKAESGAVEGAEGDTL